MLPFFITPDEINDFLDEVWEETEGSDYQESLFLRPNHDGYYLIGCMAQTYDA